MLLISFAKMSYFQSTLIMKKLFPILLLLFTGSRAAGQSDTIMLLLDHNDKPVTYKHAPRYALVHPDKDRWKKVVFDAFDDKPIWGAYFSDAACNKYDGPYSFFNKNGRVITTGKYINNKKEGVWRIYSDDGKLLDSSYYQHNFIHGLALSWYTDGKPRDSSFFENDGNGTLRGYYSNGFMRQQGNFQGGKKEGRWIYFDPKTGKKSQEVMYQADSALSFTCFDEKGNIQTSNCIYEREASFKGGDEAWMKYLLGKLESAKYPKVYQNGEVYGVVMVQFVVNTEGKTTDIKVLQSVHPDLDDVAVAIIQNSPKWIPAIQYNQPVKAYRKQPITFSRVQEE